MHFGANIGAAGGRSRLRYQAADKRARWRLAMVGASADQRVRSGPLPPASLASTWAADVTRRSSAAARSFWPGRRWPRQSTSHAAHFARAFANLAVTSPGEKMGASGAP
jgi:hypothetical protein